jgi:positive regulator of sigma E activity
VANFFFPLFLLSSMEADTMLVPYSPVMLRSLLKTPAGWCIVYFETLVLLVVVAMLLAVGVIFFPLATVVLAAPLLATAMFIQAKLYGRLAWHIGQTQSQQKKRKRKKKVGAGA